ncbi:hypothetical protein B0H13DRAFT_1887152 [Mycena leptocephala]|nr:hypothetical protein B0H13DRAFT_1887152 [Mycena leptocephala]
MTTTPGRLVVVPAASSIGHSIAVVRLGVTKPQSFRDVSLHGNVYPQHKMGKRMKNTSSIGKQNSWVQPMCRIIFLSPRALVSATNDLSFQGSGCNEEGKGNKSQETVLLEIAPAIT